MFLYTQTRPVAARHEEPKPGGFIIESKDSLSRALLCVRVAVEYKGRHPVVLKVSEMSSFSDYFVIVSGRSSRQVTGIVEHIERKCREEGFRPIGIEGKQEGQWVLMDFGDVIVHVFYDPVREFYDLESLWSEAQQIELEPELRASEYQVAEAHEEATIQ